MLSDAKSTPTMRARVTAVIPIEDRGRHELLRLAAALGNYLQPTYRDALSAAAHGEGIMPATVEMVIAQNEAQGVVANVEERRLALGQYSYLLQFGLVPRAAEVHVARHIAATGNTALYLILMDVNRCLGIIGIETREMSGVAPFKRDEHAAIPTSRS